MWSARSRISRQLVRSRHADLAVHSPILLAQTLVHRNSFKYVYARQQQRSFFDLKKMIQQVLSFRLFDSPAKKIVDKLESDADASSDSIVTEELPPLKMVGSSDKPTYSIGEFARLADGGVMATCGKSMILTTAVSQNGRKKGKDFLPLMVDYRVKYYASGIIPDTARRKEFSGSDEEILQSRVIDRVIRPLFPKDFFDETQIIATVHSYDPDNDPLVLAINSTSAALATSDIPWDGPVGCVRVVQVDGQLVLNPTEAQKEAASLNILYAGNQNRTIMIEAEGDQIGEERLSEALRFAHDGISDILKAQRELIKLHGKEKRQYDSLTIDKALKDQAEKIGLQDAVQAIQNTENSKKARQNAEKHIFGKIISMLRDRFKDRQYEDQVFTIVAHDTFRLALRDQIMHQRRFDGRQLAHIREIDARTSILPMAHGSAAFSRGDTQALCSVTLGSLDKGLRLRSATIDPSDESEYKHAMLHYEFPPYCVNETGRLGGINRRMIGHGALAEKAILPILPSTTEFPYTIRMTSEITGSDGSSSMATICGVSLALLDAGVPIEAPIAGISVGLVTEARESSSKFGKYRLITDILGLEDHYGDMDFKVAGTRRGITAIQLDVKIPGVPLSVLFESIEKAREARHQILESMERTLAKPRHTLKNGASQTGEANIMEVFKVPTTSIRFLIGKAGANIRSMEKTTGCTISIDRNDGMIRVTGPPDLVQNAKNLIVEFTDGTFFKIGSTYTMKVTDLMDFGASLESTSPVRHRAFIHISELPLQQPQDIREHLKIGDEIKVVCIEAGISGKMSVKGLQNKSADTIGTANILNHRKAATA